MPFDRSYAELNRASTARIRALAERLTDEQLLHPVGEHWTVAIALAHLAFWEQRVLQILERTERTGRLQAPMINVVMNDLSLPLWAAIPPRTAANLAIDAAQRVDRRLEDFPQPLAEMIYNRNERWVIRSLHRNEHLDEIDAALKS